MASGANNGDPAINSLNAPFAKVRCEIATTGERFQHVGQFNNCMSLDGVEPSSRTYKDRALTIELQAPTVSRFLTVLKH